MNQRNFRWIGYAEGISFLVLLGIAMPLKHIWGEPLAVRVVGWVHGLLFVTYVMAAAICSDKFGWTRKELALALMAAVLPFGPFWVERRLPFAQK